MKKNKNGYYRKTFTFQGKRFTVYGKTLEEALLKMLKKKEDLKTGSIMPTSNTTVRNWTMRAVNTYKTNQKEITRKKFVSRIEKNILAYIGNRPLKSIKSIELQELVNRQSGKSKTHVSEIYNAIKFIFQTAVQNSLLDKNPAEHLQKPNYYIGKRRALTDFERLHFLKVLPTDRRFLVFAIMYYCGCRPSEARNVIRTDFEKVDENWFLKIRGTKTKNATRTVPVPSDFVISIKEYLAKISFDRLATTGTGNAIDSRTFVRIWKRLTREINISMGANVYRNSLVPPLPLAEDLVPYCLRHTYCTDLLKAGIDLRVAQHLMGHSSIELTADIYTHIDESMIFKAAEILNRAKSIT